MAAGAAVTTWLERVRRAPSSRIVRQLSACGIRPADFELGDLSRIASLRPCDVGLDGADPVGDARLADAPVPIRLGACERGGHTILVTFSAADLERTAACGARALAAAGIERGMRVANTLEGGLDTPGSLIVGDALERLGALDAPLGPVRDAKSARAMAELFDRTAIDVLIADDASGAALIDALHARPPRAWRGTLWLGAERHAPDGRRWWRRWVSLPELSVFFAVECTRGSLHCDPDVHVEVRPTGLRFSSLSGDAPLFAYDPGIPLRVDPRRCACGDPRPCVETADPI